MPYAPPLIKPPLPPLRPPVAPPYRPPGPIFFPPTQTAPIYQPPDLLPPTGLDLKGVVCIYSNAPIWELKKIRYRYPGEAWREISGERYSLNTVYGDYNQQGFVSVRIIIRICYLHRKRLIGDSSLNDIYGYYSVVGKILGVDIKSKNGFTVVSIEQEIAPGNFADSLVWSASNKLSENPCLTDDVFSPVADNISKTASIAEIVQYIGETQCEFKVFDIFDQEILSITREDCPDVIVVPEKCYFKAENERLVARVIQTLLDPPLRVEYQGHCATVWKDGIIDLPPYPLQIYKECSDNPNCPPPRIRFDQKCEEKCEQCPPGTTIKVLLGNRIACVDAFGCIKKMIKYKPGCNVYDCVCG